VLILPHPALNSFPCGAFLARSLVAGLIVRDSRAGRGLSNGNPPRHFALGDADEEGGPDARGKRSRRA
jgi:hypothetical protein